MEKYINKGKKGFFDLIKNERRKGNEVVVKHIKFDEEDSLVYALYVYRATNKTFGRTITTLHKFSNKGKYLVPSVYGVPLDEISVCKLICEAA